VGSLTVVVLEVDIEHSLHVRTPEDEHPIQALSRTVRTHRSAKALARGARMGVQITWGPVGAEDLVEARDVLRVPVPDEEAEGHPVGRMIEGQVSSPAD
jgi:hypothetical protein